MQIENITMSAFDADGGDSPFPIALLLSVAITLYRGLFL